METIPRQENVSFPNGAGVLLGIGLGGFFDGIVLHQILQWHHVISSAGYTPDTVDNLRLNTLADGLFHAASYVVLLVGILLFWQRAHRRHGHWSGKMLAGSMLIGFGGFNLVEGAINHHLLGLHHVNETASPHLWFWWDLAFLGWGALMLFVGAWLHRRGREAKVS